MNQRAALLAAVLFASSLASSGCNSPGSSSSTSTTTTSATVVNGGAASLPAAPVAPATASASDVIDVCAALSAADMAQASGRPVVVAEKGKLSECTYRSNEKIRLEYIVRVGVLHGVHIGGSKQDAKNYMTVTRKPDSLVHRFGPAVEIPGLGDEAIQVIYAEGPGPKDVDTIAVLARKGDSIVELIHAPGIEPERVVETAKNALPKVLAVL
jgi:hypothetical protein